MKKEIGQKYRVLNDGYEVFKKGDLVELVEIHEESVSVYENEDGKRGWLIDIDDQLSEVEIIKKLKDLRELLKVGYKVVGSDGSELIIGDYDYSTFLKRVLNENLCGLYYQVTKIYKPENEWELVWKLKETKYYIKPKGMVMVSDHVMNFNTEKEEWLQSNKECTNIHKTEFTIDEMIELGLNPDNFDKEEVE